jgi:hypothetical protein
MSKDELPMDAESSRDPWTDDRPMELRKAERKRRFAPINDPVRVMGKYDEEINKQRLRRFSRLTMTSREMKAEIEQLEQLIALMRTYPESPVRQHGIDHYESELTIALQHADRLAKASRFRLGKGPDPEGNLDFKRVKYVDLVGLVSLLSGQAGYRSGDNTVFYCPFHDEDSPSLTVYPPGGGWFCFGCGKGGDAPAFAAEWFQGSMVEGLRWVEELCDVTTNVQGTQAADH